MASRARQLSKLLSSDLLTVDVNNNRIGVNSTSPEETLDVRDSLTVGFDTSTTSRDLHVYSDLGTPVRIETTKTTSNIEFMDSETSSTFNVKVGSVGDNLALKSENATTFLTGSGTGTEKMRLTSDGLIGIGTTNPATKLDVVNGDITIRNGSQHNAIRTNAAGQLQFLRNAAANNTISVTINDEDGNVGIGSTIPSHLLTVQGTTGITGTIKVGEIDTSVNNLRDSQTTIDRVPKIQVTGGNGVAASFGLVAYNSNEPGFYSPQLWLAKSNGAVGTDTIVTDNTDLGAINFAGNDGSKFLNAASIRAEVDGTPGSDDMPGRLVFYTTNNGGSTPNEAMRISESRHIFFGGYTTTFPGVDNTDNGMMIERTSSGMSLFVSRNTSTPVYFNRNNDGDVLNLRRGGNDVGALRVSSTQSFFDNTSDYRLKENVVGLTSAISRVKQLSPKSFNFIAEPGLTIDGFLAHEVTLACPNAVFGEHNAVDEDNNPLYQKVDPTKLIPLLTAALKESISEIEALKARVAVLEGN